MTKLLFSMIAICMVLLTTMLWVVMYAFLVIDNTIDPECMFMGLTVIMSTAVTAWTIQYARAL